MLTSVPVVEGKKLSFHVYFKENMRRFLIETSLNGLKYIEDVHRNIWERGYYLISFSTVFTCGLYMAWYFFQRWQSTPVIIGISPKATSIQDVPFPAVTFCNMNNALASKVKDFQPDTPEHALLQTICFQDYNYSHFKDFQPRFEGDNLLSFQLKYSQNCNDMIIYCKYGPYEEPCTNLFRYIVLDEGICCIFNHLHPFFRYTEKNKVINDYTSVNGRTSIPVTWNLETGYTEPLPKSFYPRKAAGCGVSMGLTVALYADIDEYFCSSTNSAGFKVLLYNPLESPQIKETGLPIRIGHQTRLRINAKLMESQPSLRYTKPKDRQCYFSKEKKLLYYKYYTRRCCETECNAMQILRLCKCIPHHMPKVASNATICFLGDINCVVKAERMTLEPEILKCKAECLPACHDLQYYPDMFVTPLARKNFSLQDPFFRNISKDALKKNIAFVEIYYKDNDFRGNTKVPYMGLTEFLSQTGGIMSLMVGFSVISIYEVFFFILLKPCLDIIMKRNPSILDDADEVKEKKYKNNKAHPQVLFKIRKNIHNRVSNLDQHKLQQYHTERY